ncbi:hypothetical protein SteCoe_7198 [Stentor coeruleus]|uniref:Uncharacterized protein n=1 Tax=Stentor coeruleus TaxID=5963 RepID=A0A1R2CN56_9CILI|nr:hypothetical protein SteCoe_7198 [Stentor coeruleus]
MDNSTSASFSISSASRSFFSSFASHLSSNTTLKSMLSSFQENHRLSRLVQVRETNIKELKDDLHNSPLPKTNQLSTINDTSKFSNPDKIDGILELSRKNLRMMSKKIGNIPRKLIKALEVVDIDFKKLSAKGKFECLSAMELLKEKIFDLSLDSNEIMNYFKDILLEVEAQLVKSYGNKEDMIKIVEQGVEIQESNNTSRTKIQEMYHLIMKMQGLCSRDDTKYTNKIGSGYEVYIKQLSDEINKKNQEIKDLKKKYKENVEDVFKKNSILKNDLKKLRHCVEFELFSTWSYFIDNDNNELSCYSAIRKIVKNQGEKSFQIKNTEKKAQDLKIAFEGIKKDYEKFMMTTVKGYQDSYNKAIKKLIEKEAEIQKCKSSLKIFKEDTISELNKMQSYINDIAVYTKKYVNQKLGIHNRTQELQSLFLILKNDYSQHTQQTLSLFTKHKISHQNIKKKLLKPLTETLPLIHSLSSQQRELKKTITQEYPKIFTDLKALFNIKSFEEIFNSYMIPLKTQTKMLKSEVLDMKVDIAKNLQDFGQDMMSRYSKILLKCVKGLEDRNYLQVWLKDNNEIIKRKLEEHKEEIMRISKDKMIFCHKIMGLQEKCYINKTKNKEDMLKSKNEIQELRGRYDKIIKAVIGFIEKAHRINDKKKVDWEEEKHCFISMFKLVQGKCNENTIINERLKHEMTMIIKDKDLKINELEGNLTIKNKEIKEFNDQIEILTQTERELTQFLAEERMKIKDLEEELNRMHEDLDETQENLNQAQDNLTQTENELLTTKECHKKLQAKNLGIESKVVKTTENLEKTKLELENESNKRRELEVKLKLIIDELTQANDQKKMTNEKLMSTQFDMKNTQKQLESALEKIMIIKNHNEKMSLEIIQIQNISQNKTLELKTTLEALQETQEKLSITERELKNNKGLLDKKMIIIRKIPLIKQGLHKFALELNYIYKDIIIFKEEIKDQLRILQQSSQNTSEKHGNLKIHILQLEETKRELDKNNLDLNEKYDKSNKKNTELLCRENTYKKNLSLKAQRLLNKVKSFKNVLGKEKNHYTFVLKGLSDWFNTSVLVDIKNKFSQIEANLQADFITKSELLKKEFDIKEQKAHELNAKSKQIQNNSCIRLQKVIKSVKNDTFLLKTQVKDHISHTFHLFSDLQNQLHTKILFLQTYKQKTKSYNFLIKDLKTQNQSLRNTLNETFKSYNSEIEYLKTTLEFYFRKDTFIMPNTLENLLHAYSSAHSELIHENAKTHKMIEIHNGFQIPVNRFINENQEGISEINDVFCKNTEIVQRNLEENIKKIEKMCLKVEELNDLGSEIVCKYRKDCVLTDIEQGLGENTGYKMKCCETKVVGLRKSDKKNKENNPKSVLKEKDNEDKRVLKEKNTAKIICYKQNHIPTDFAQNFSLELIKTRFIFDMFISNHSVIKTSHEKGQKFQVTEMIENPQEIYSSHLTTEDNISNSFKHEKIFNTVWSLAYMQYCLNIKSISVGRFNEILCNEKILLENNFTEGLNRNCEKMVELVDPSGFYGGNFVEEETL